MVLDKKIEPQSRWIIILRWLFFFACGCFDIFLLIYTTFVYKQYIFRPYGPETGSLYFKICLTFFINMFQGGVLYMWAQELPLIIVK